MSVAQTESHAPNVEEEDQRGLLEEVAFLELLSALPRQLLTTDFMEQAYSYWINDDHASLTRLIQRQFQQNLHTVI